LQEWIQCIPILAHARQPLCFHRNGRDLGSLRFIFALEWIPVLV